MSRYIITAPVAFTGTGYGLVFVGGKAVTNSGRIANHLEQKGYVIEEQVESIPSDTIGEPEAMLPEQTSEMPDDASAEPQEESPPPRRRGRAAAKEAPPPEGTEHDG